MSSRCGPAWAWAFWRCSRVILNISPELYEAGAIDGVRNRLQEVFYITIPSMKPQMLFGAVMSVVGAFQAGNIGVMLTGANPTPGYAAQLMVNHIEDYGFLRYEMGYAAAVSVSLLGIIYAFLLYRQALVCGKRVGRRLRSGDQRQ